MSAFDAALAALHSDPNLSRSATYFVNGTGDGVAVRVVWAEPEREADFGQTGAVAREIEADVRLAEIAEPKRGDQLVSLNRYSVEKVLKDSECLSARLTLKAVATP